MSRIIRGEKPDLQKVRQEAYQEGLARGREEGRASIAALLARAQKDRAQEAASLETHLVSLSLEIVGRILGDLAQTPEVASRVAREALKAAGAPNPRLLVHPEDLKEVKAQLGDSCDVVGDPSVSRGGCIVETDWGRIDARLETQLARLREALLEGE